MSEGSQVVSRRWKGTTTTKLLHSEYHNIQLHLYHTYQKHLKAAYIFQKPRMIYLMRKNVQFSTIELYQPSPFIFVGEPSSTKAEYSEWVIFHVFQETSDTEKCQKTNVYALQNKHNEKSTYIIPNFQLFFFWKADARKF